MTPLVCIYSVTYLFEEKLETTDYWYYYQKDMNNGTKLLMIKKLSAYFSIVLLVSACANTGTPVVVNDVPVNPETEGAQQLEKKGVPGWVWALGAVALIGLAVGGSSDEGPELCFNSQGLRIDCDF